MHDFQLNGAYKTHPIRVYTHQVCALSEGRAGGTCITFSGGGEMFVEENVEYVTRAIDDDLADN